MNAVLCDERLGETLEEISGSLDAVAVRLCDLSDEQREVILVRLATVAKLLRQITE